MNKETNTIILLKYLMYLTLCAAASSIIYVSCLQENEQQKEVRNPNIQYLEDPENVNYDTVNTVYK